jgi:hypothetical protein
MGVVDRAGLDGSDRGEVVVSDWWRCDWFIMIVIGYGARYDSEL